MLNKKTISPVVAIALLLVVAVVAVVGFQNWYSGFQSSLLVDTEQRSSSASGSVNIEFISADGIIYITNTGTSNVSMSTIKVGDADCNLNQNLSPGVNNISIVSCLSDSGTNDVMILTDDGIIEESLFIETVIGTCTLNSITTFINENYTFYNSSLVPFGDSCSSHSQVRVCNDGTYSGDTTFNKSSCSVIGQDISPTSFSFSNQSNIAFSTLITSNSLVPTNYDGPLVVGITGDGSPQLSVNGGSWTISATMDPTDSLQIRLTSANLALNTRVANLTIGDYSTIWGVETEDPLNCSALGLAGGTWTTVLGSATFGTSDFCVMTYEAKNVGGVATSQAEITPWTNINFANSRISCSNLGAGYHLITNREWMTIARDIENMAISWSGGAVGSGMIYRGNSAGNDVGSYDGANPDFGSSRNIKSRLFISTYEEIWDFSGNVWEWVDQNEDGSTSSGNICGGSDWYKYNTGGPWSSQPLCSFQNPYSKNGASDKRYELGPIGNFHEGNGMGGIYSYPPSNTNFVRGGGYLNLIANGIYGIGMYDAPSTTDPSFGFRCTYTIQ